MRSHGLPAIPAKDKPLTRLAIRIEIFSTKARIVTPISTVSIAADKDR